MWKLNSLDNHLAGQLRATAPREPKSCPMPTPFAMFVLDLRTEAPMLAPRPEMEALAAWLNTPGTSYLMDQARDRNAQLARRWIELADLLEVLSPLEAILRAVARVAAYIENRDRLARRKLKP